MWRASKWRSKMVRVSVQIHGAVQGVGFRPFVYRLASELGLKGWVINDSRGVFIEAEGEAAHVNAFVVRLQDEKPPLAIINALEVKWLEPRGFEHFEIRHSDDSGGKTVLVLPDIATCADCLNEVFDPGDRRYRYPFTNCTNCGPRFSIIQALPYDRPNTTMSRFIMCAACQTEYENPLDRRFHAQPNACPVCGPSLALWDREGKTLSHSSDEALRQTAQALREGKIVAVKGLGGFHLMCDARNADAVALLRERKPRRDKPFALMARDLAQAARLVEISPEARGLLASPQAPIALLPRRDDAPVADNVAPGNPTLGVMLPYTPLHHLLLHEIDFTVVATSGNLTDEPICTDENDAIRRLGHIADLFLVHNRPIERHVDDSVAWLVEGKPRLLRRARGYAPLPIPLTRAMPTILAVGAHLKNTVALSVGDQAFISQHIGDLETAQAMRAFERVIRDFLRMYEAKPTIIAHDMHPDYLATKWAKENADERVKLAAVQHHHAHLAAVLAENQIEGPALGVIWDGTGFGTDGAIWGGEFLLGDAAEFERVAHLRPFRLPGGDKAIKEPRRIALALLWEMFGRDACMQEDLAPVAAFERNERRLLTQMLEKNLHAPLTTSAGRLFDGVAALLDLHQVVSFEGQAAMALEFATDPAHEDAYPLPLSEVGPPWVLDWRPLLSAVLADLRSGAPTPTIAARFHNALIEAILATARRTGEPRVALSGGCFQNRILTERAAQRLRAAGFEVILHRQVPPNDGGVSLGQIAVAARKMND
ncbi:MAG: carbamoyltransferase HypF [Chloroflexi bacterium]|nr:carbamoyltransferase HypF [Chloroflexota bacterium]